MSGHALEMKCPHCCAWGEHPVITTDPGRHLPFDGLLDENNQRTDSFSSYYRIRRKRCVHCGNPFDTVEMQRNYFSYLLEYYKNSAETHYLKSEVVELRATNKRLQEAVDLSAKQLSPVATPKRTKPSTQQPHPKAA